MLVIEGSDCLGKTILAKKIVRYVTEQDTYPVMYSHMSRPNGSFDFFTGYKHFINPYVVQDRFHLGALAYHTNVMPAENLRIIEGWIHGAGGLVVLIFCSDHEWYRDKLEHDPRGNILPIDMMCTANEIFHKMASQEELSPSLPWIDWSIDVNERVGYVDDQTAWRIADKWIMRRNRAITALNF